MATQTAVFILVFLTLEIKSNPTNPFIPGRGPQSVLMAQRRQDFNPDYPKIKYTFADYVYNLDEKRKSNANLSKKGSLFISKLFEIINFQLLMMLKILYSEAMQYHLALEKQHANSSYIPNRSFKEDRFGMQGFMHNELDDPYYFVQKPQFTGFL